MRKPIAVVLAVLSTLILALVPMTANALHAPTTMISRGPSQEPGNGESLRPSISADGRYVAFESAASNLVPGDTNGVRDVFLRDLQTNSTRRISISAAGEQGNASSHEPDISADGRVVVFESQASNLVVGDTNGIEDVFVHDLFSGETTRVSVRSSGEQVMVGEEAFNDSHFSPPSISADGQVVAFSSAMELVLGTPWAGEQSIFIHDRRTHQTEIVSLTSAGQRSGGASWNPSISGDGRFVTFMNPGVFTPEENFPGASGDPDIFLHDRADRTATRISVPMFGAAEGSTFAYLSEISPDGRYIGYAAIFNNPPDLAVQQFSGIIIYNRETGTRTAASSLPNGANGALRPSFSADGRYVAFWGFDGQSGIHVYDQVTGTRTHPVAAVPSPTGGLAPGSLSLSGDGQVIVFASRSRLVSDDVNDLEDVYVDGHEAANPPADTTPPVITPVVSGVVGGNGWYTSDVGVTWTVTDAESGITGTNGCSSVSIIADTAGTVLTCEATSAGGTSSASVTIKRDATAPSLAPALSPNPVLFNGAATAVPGATDAMSGIAEAACGAVTTSVVGPDSVDCWAQDFAGNTATAATSYAVQYIWQGFFAPVDNGNVLNVAKAGSVVPLKWRIVDASGAPVEFSTTVKVTVVSLNCSLGTTADELEEYATGSSGLQYQGDGHYQFNWKTNPDYANSCKRLHLDLGEGITHTADFQFK